MLISARKGVQLNFSKAAVIHMEKRGGFLPFLLPALAALGTGALSGVTSWGVPKLLNKITGGAIKGKKRETV